MNTRILMLTSSLILGRQHRMEEGIDLTRLRDEHTRQFAEAVVAHLEHVIGLIRRGDAENPPAVKGAKAEIDTLAAAARRSVLDKLRLDERADVLDFRRATDLIEAFRQIARFSRRIAKTVREQGL